MSLILPQT